MDERGKKEAWWRWTDALAVVLAVLFVGRAAYFATTYAGIEYDSGRCLGVAKILAHHGIYASYTNTATAAGAGPQSSIQKRPIVQDDQGYTYFPASVSVGPGYVFPEALVIFLFGDGWWQYRAWPMLAYFFLLLGTFAALGRLVPLGLIMFPLWLWATPQFHVQFAYEALSEPIALLYTLCSFWLWQLAVSGRASRTAAVFFLAGTLFGAACLTKALSLLTGGAFVAAAGYDLFWGRPLASLEGGVRKFGRRTGEYLSFVVGVLIPLLGFQVYRYQSLTHRFGAPGFEAANEDERLLYLEVAPSLSLREQSWSSLSNRLEAWLDLGFRNSIFGWVVLLAAVVVVMRNLDNKLKPIFFLGAGLIFCHLLWLLLLSSNLYARDVFQMFFVSMVVISAAGAYLLPWLVQSERSWRYALPIFSLAAVIVAFRPGWFDCGLLLDSETAARWRGLRHLRSPSAGFPALALIGRSEQQEVVDYFAKSVASEERVYYLDGFPVAELSTLTGRPFYSVYRYADDLKRGLVQGRPIVVFGPYQTGPSSIVDDNYFAYFSAKACNDTLIETGSYKLCVFNTSFVSELQFNP